MTEHSYTLTVTSVAVDPANNAAPAPSFGPFHATWKSKAGQRSGLLVDTFEDELNIEIDSDRYCQLVAGGIVPDGSQAIKLDWSTTAGDGDNVYLTFGASGQQDALWIFTGQLDAKPKVSYANGGSWQHIIGEDEDDFGVWKKGRSTAVDINL